MGNKIGEKRLKVRAAMFADAIITDLPETDPKVKALSRNALIAGWVTGYGEAMADVLRMRADAPAIKH